MANENEKLSGEGQKMCAIDGQRSSADTGQPELQGEGHAIIAREGQSHDADALQPDSGEEGQHTDANVGHRSCAAFAATIAAIRALHRARNYAMAQRKRADQSLGAFLRTELGWSKTLPEAERDRISERAVALIALGEAEAKGKAADVEEPVYVKWRHIIAASIAGRAPFDIIENSATKEMERLAKFLPVWPWVERTRGFSARGLAVIVGEAGDLSAYPKKGHLWKRLGLAPKDGKAYSTWRKTGGMSKDDWVDAGYSPRRRSRMFVIGDVLVKVGDHYRDVYLKRKDYERGKAKANGLTVCPSAKIPKGRADEFMSDGYVHKRAQRYMEKMLLRDLWSEWRAAPQMYGEAT